MEWSRHSAQKKKVHIPAPKRPIFIGTSMKQYTFIFSQADSTILVIVKTVKVSIGQVAHIGSKPFTYIAIDLTST